MAGKGQLLLDADGVGGRKNKLVFTGKWPTRGDTHAQQLTAAIGESAPVDESFKASIWWLQRAATVLNTKVSISATYYLVMLLTG